MVNLPRNNPTNEQDGRDVSFPQPRDLAYQGALDETVYEIVFIDLSRSLAWVVNYFCRSGTDEIVPIYRLRPYKDAIA